MYGFSEKVDDEFVFYLNEELKLNSWENNGYVRKSYIIINKI